MKKQALPSQKELKFAILATDIALFTLRDGKLLVRLISVDRPPFFTDMSGLPGGLIRPDETAEDAVLRHIEEKAKVDAKSVYIEQLYTFSSIDRDPRGRVVAVAYSGYIPWESLSPTEQEDTKETWWASSTSKGLAYDHTDILALTRARLKTRIAYTTLIAKLLPKEFTLTELETAYETILGKEIDKRNFRKKILKLDVLTALGRKRSGGAFRPAELYSFTEKSLREVAML
jgi:8-oxo-dGTP diphosphatase